MKVSDAEIWRKIPAYEGVYEVSNSGRVRRIGGGVLKLGADKRGTRSVRLSLHGKTRLFLVHRLMAIAFIPNPRGYPIVRHLNDISYDNRLENLAWGTQLHNMHDMIRNRGHHYSNRTHCKNGHEFTPENTRKEERRNRKSRVCVECHRIASLKYVRKIREESR